MGDVVLPVVPATVLVLLNFFAPYATALIVQPPWPDAWKKWVSVGVSLLLAAGVIALSFYGFGVEVPSWPQFLLLGVLVSQTSYDLLLKKTATNLAALTSKGDK